MCVPFGDEKDTLIVCTLDVPKFGQISNPLIFEQVQLQEFRTTDYETTLPIQQSGVVKTDIR